MAMKSQIQSLSLLAWPSGSLCRLGAFVLQNPHTSLLLGQLGVPFAMGPNQGKGTKPRALPAGLKTALCRAGWLWLGDRQKGWDALCMSVLCLVICGKHCHRAWYHVSLLFWFRNMCSLGWFNSLWQLMANLSPSFLLLCSEGRIINDFVSFSGWRKSELAHWLMGWACIHLAKLFCPRMRWMDPYRHLDMVPGQSYRTNGAQALSRRTELASDGCASDASDWRSAKSIPSSGSWYWHSQGC